MGWTFTTYKHSTVIYMLERTPSPSAGFKGFMVSWVYDTYSTVLNVTFTRSKQVRFSLVRFQLTVLSMRPHSIE